MSAPWSTRSSRCCAATSTRSPNTASAPTASSRACSNTRAGSRVSAGRSISLNLAYHGARAQDASFNITLERDLEPGLAPMELAPQELTRVFLNLFGNGFYATTKRQRDGAGP